MTGGDETKVSEYASWAPAFLAVGTGLGGKSTALGYALVGGVLTVKTVASPFRLPSCN